MDYWFWVKALAVLIAAMVLIPAAPTFFVIRLAMRGDQAAKSGAAVTAKRRSLWATALLAATFAYAIFFAMPLAQWGARALLDSSQPQPQQRFFNRQLDRRTWMTVLIFPSNHATTIDGGPIDVSARIMETPLSGACDLDIRSFSLALISAGLEVASNPAPSNLLHTKDGPVVSNCSLGWTWPTMPSERYDDYSLVLAVKEARGSGQPLEDSMPLSIHIARSAALSGFYRLSSQILLLLLAALIPFFLGTFKKRFSVPNGDDGGRIERVRLTCAAEVRDLMRGARPTL